MLTFVSFRAFRGPQIRSKALASFIVVRVQYIGNTKGSEHRLHIRHCYDLNRSRHAVERNQYYERKNTIRN